LLFHRNNGRTKAPQGYVIPTLPFVNIKIRGAHYHLKAFVPEERGLRVIFDLLHTHTFKTFFKKQLFTQILHITSYFCKLIFF
jgi:hypothetical protein